MRIWQNAKGDFITDEQLLRHIASHGSLAAALEVGDIRLVTGTAKEPLHVRSEPKKVKPHAKLASFL